MGAEPLFPQVTFSPLLIVSTCHMTSTIPTMSKYFLESTALLIVRTPRPMWRRSSCTPNTTLGLSTTTLPSCLSSPVNFTTEVSPACLPADVTATYVNAVATVTGWGTLESGGWQPTELHEVD